MVVGLLQVEVHVSEARTLKDKRAVVKSLREQLRGRFNVAVSELDANDTWQRATLGIAALGDETAVVEGALRDVTTWLRQTRMVELIRIEQELW